MIFVEQPIMNPSHQEWEKWSGQPRELTVHIYSNKLDETSSLEKAASIQQEPRQDTAGNRLSNSGQPALDIGRAEKTAYTASRTRCKVITVSRGQRNQVKAAHRERQRCSQCGYSTHTQQMLRIHLRRTKHHQQNHREHHPALSSITRPPPAMDSGHSARPRAVLTGAGGTASNIPSTEEILWPQLPTSNDPSSSGRSQREEALDSNQQSPVEEKRARLSQAAAIGCAPKEEVLRIEPFFACPQIDCSVWSHQKESLVAHIRLKHPQLRSLRRSVVPLRRRCPHCPYVSTHLGNMRIHVMARHSNTRPHLCYLCGHSFADKSYYNIHMKRHSNDLRYSCDLCEARFVQPSHLRSHVIARHRAASTIVTKGEISTAGQSGTRAKPAVATRLETQRNTSDRGAPDKPDTASTDATDCAGTNDLEPSAVCGGSSLSGYPFFEGSGPTSERGNTAFAADSDPGGQIVGGGGDSDELYTRSADEGIKWQLFECIDCNTFFVSFERLKAHVEMVHPESLNRA